MKPVSFIALACAFVSCFLAAAESTKPLMASEGAKAPAMADVHGPSITDAGIGEPDIHP